MYQHLPAWQSSGSGVMREQHTYTNEGAFKGGYTQTDYHQQYRIQLFYQEIISASIYK